MPVTDPRLQVILDQLETLLIFLERPVIQRQLLAFVVAVALAGACGYAIRYTLHKRFGTWYQTQINQTHDLFLYRLIALPRLILFPVLSIIFVRIAANVLSRQGGLTGLLIESMILFWAILIYRIFMAILFAIFGEQKMHFYYFRLLAPAFGLLIIGRIVSYLIDLNLLSQIEILRMFGTPLTLGNLFITSIALYFLVTIAQAIQQVLQDIIVPRTKADPGTVNAMLTIGRYSIIAVGLFVVFNSLGLDLSTLAFIGGGLSIGIGFGLQQIVANFISGIILLFEQSLRPGDVIDIDGEIATVQKLSIRSTTVRTLNNVEVVLPNESILASAVRTYTKTNRLVRVLLEVGTSYGSDPKEVREVLLQAAQRHGLVQKDPAPYVFFKQFGESSIDFKLAFWLNEPTLTNKVSSELYFMIWYALAEHNIEIPFPQRDLHLKSGFLVDQGEGFDSAS